MMDFQHFLARDNLVHSGLDSWIEIEYQ